MPLFREHRGHRDMRLTSDGRWISVRREVPSHAHRVGPGALRSHGPGGLPVGQPEVDRGEQELSAVIPHVRDVRAGGSVRRLELKHPLARTNSAFPWHSLALKGGLAVAVIAILIGSVAMMPLVLAGQTGPTSTPTAASTATPRASVSATTALVSPVAVTSPTAAPGRSATAIPNSVFMLYRVAAGDNLTRIANSFDLSVTTLYWANSDAIPNPDLVRIGQSLLIPPVDGKVVTATEGQTPQSIADQFGIDPQVIVDVNNLSGLALSAGQMLILPGVPNKPMPRPVAASKPTDWLNKLTWPVPSSHRLTLLFGCTNYYAEPAFGNCRHWHNALDIGARWGVPVVAAAGGTVIYAGWRKAGTDGAAGGIVVWISHGGTLYTTYNHLSGVTVKAGQRIAAGQQVGKIGATGAADGAHLHFEVWIDYPWTGGTVADSRDPLKYTTWKP